MFEATPEFVRAAHEERVRRLQRSRYGRSRPYRRPRPARPEV